MTDTTALVGAWAVMLAATLAALAVHGVLGAGTAGVLAVLVVTFGKVWLVGRYFMELRTAPAVLRRVFDGYVLVVAAGLAVVVMLV